MVFMMVGVIFIDLDFAKGFQKNIILEVLSDKLLSGTSPYLEDILHPPEVILMVGVIYIELDFA